MDYYAHAQWTDRAPLLLQGLLVEAFEKSQRIAAVGRESAGIRSDYILQSELHDFEAYYAVPDTPPKIRVSLSGVSGTDRKSTRLNSSHVSESRMPSSA